MKKNKNNKAQKLEKTNLVEGINTLIEEKAEKVEKSKKALKKGEEETTAQVAEEKKKKKSKKDKLVAKAQKKVEANLVEEVVTKREVKYIYPADCEDTLSRKKVRNKIHQLELAMLRIENQDSKEFKKAKKEYLEYKNQFVKESVAI